MVIAAIDDGRGLKDGSTVALQLRLRHTGPFTILFNGRPVPAAAAVAAALPSSQYAPAAAPSDEEVALKRATSTPEPAVQTGADRLVQHRFSQTSADLLRDLYKCLKETAAESWEPVRTTRGVTISRKPVASYPLGFLRGETVISGFTPAQVHATITLFSARAHCTLPSQRGPSGA